MKFLKSLFSMGERINSELEKVVTTHHTNSSTPHVILRKSHPEDFDNPRDDMVQIF